MPTLPPAAGPALPEYVRELDRVLVEYLGEDQRALVIQAFLLGADAHGSQTRKSGEPYITHPVAVARILAEMRMDAETLIAAILHDTLEDTPLSKESLTAQFGEQVAELVDGVTKLDKVQFRSRQEAAAESFRKMLLAMARDLRVILIKLADRLHNMRTLDAMADESRRRIARETLEIYAPIAQRLGMNRMKAELQGLGFAALYPTRFRVIERHLRTLQGHRRENMGRIEAQLLARLEQEGLSARVVSRVKSPYSIYNKMRAEHKPLSQVLDVYGFRVVVPKVMDCYHAIGVVHNLFKPLEGRFKDYIAIPKANGYQSLHTVLFGPYGAPIEVQVRTEDMDTIAEKGIAAHWLYKGDGSQVNSAQNRAREWLLGLLEAQKQAGSSLEFLENVRVDLFPDEVYLFTPKGRILALPKNSTALDFAYAVHTNVGDHAVAARVDRRLVPLRSKLNSGQTVEIITAPSATPSPAWLDIVVSSKARTAIRHYLKRLQHEDAVQLGHRMLDKALEELGSTLDSLPQQTLDQYLLDNRMPRLEELLADIAFGNRMPIVVARQLVNPDRNEPAASSGAAGEAIRITGGERGVLSFGNCCHPIPGDRIMGYLTSGKGIVVHQGSCRNVMEYRKSPERWVAMDWDAAVTGDYRVALRIEVDNRPGVLATVAAAIAEAGSNIENVEYKDRDAVVAHIVFTIEVASRVHLAQVIRRVRGCKVVHAVQRT